MPEVRDEPLVEPVRDEDEVLDVRDEELVVVAPRRVVVEEPSVLTVFVVVRVEPLVLTRDVVVVLAGDTWREDELPVLLVPHVRLELEEPVW